MDAGRLVSGGNPVVKAIHYSRHRLLLPTPVS